MFFSIRLKSILTILFLALVTAIPVIYIILDKVSHQTDDLAKENVKKITKHNSEKISAILNREIALALKMADSQSIKRWILNENNQILKDDALNELESFKKILKDHSYFLAIKNSNNYYFSDKKGICNNRQKCYTLDPTNPNDKWFYFTLKSGKEFQLNIDYDEKLNQTKVWLNVLVYNENKTPIAVIGTGLDLTNFIEEILNTDEEINISSLFIDKNGYIQAHKNQKLISFRSSITNEQENLTSFYEFMKLSVEDKEKLQNIIKKLVNNSNKSVLTNLKINDNNKIVSITYIKEIGWFSLSTVDYNHLQFHFFIENGYLLLTIILSFTIFTFIVLVFMNYTIINPLEKINSNINIINNGQYNIENNVQSNDELGILSSQLEIMAKRIGNHTSELEEKVKKRTAELQKIAVTDPLTNLLNRKGVQDQWKYEYSRASRQKSHIGMLMLDIDFFKNINDTYGHNVGDRVIIEVANTITSLLRPYDIISRWGGEEYLIIFSDIDQKQLENIAQKIRVSIENKSIKTNDTIISFTVSIGGCIGKLYEEFESILSKTDKALYEAKNNGRNKFVEFHKI